MKPMTFDREGVLDRILHAKAATAWKKSYGEGKAAAALWLVGDHGVYLMSNGHPGEVVDVTDPEDGDVNPTIQITYADGINPEEETFDDWWQEKQDCFGGDDQCIPIPLAEFDEYVMAGEGPLTVTLSDSDLQLSWVPA